MKSVKEIEKITGINRQKIYREIRKNGLKPQKKISGVNYFSDDILVFFNIKSKMKNEKIKCQKSTKINTCSDFDLIQELKQELKQLREQIDIKDKQIANLLCLLDQQQKLSLADKKQIEKYNNKSESVSNFVLKKADEKVDLSSSVKKSKFKSNFKKFFSKLKKDINY